MCGSDTVRKVDESGLGRLANRTSVLSPSGTGRKLFQGDSSSNKTLRLGFKAADPGGSIASAVVNPRERQKVRDKGTEFFKGKKVDPPAVEPAPQPERSVTNAQRIARDRQRRRALASFGRRSTIRSGSLGVENRAATTRKTLLGE